MKRVTTLHALALGVLLLVSAARVHADPLSCRMTGYRSVTGLAAAQANDVLTVTWDGDRGQQVRVRFVLNAGTPTIQDLSVRRGTAPWLSLASGVTADFSVVSGLRRMSNQQLAPLRGLGVSLTPAEIDKYRWEPFWDAPLDMSTPAGRGGNPPPADGVANSPGLPRKPDEIGRASVVYRVTSCDVRTNGARLEVSFPGVQLGVFTGTLQYSIFKGTNLIQQELLATTDQPWVAYKYDAALKGLAASSGALVAWRDPSNVWRNWQGPQGSPGRMAVLKTTGRIMLTSRPAGSIAVFPPPHNFFWAREVAINLGYNWYRQDDESTFSIGIRQADHEDESENQANFALYSARPGTTQRLTMYVYPNAGDATATYDAALAFTHGDRFKPVAGYQVMNHHYHMDLGQRLGQAGSLDAEILDLVAIKALGINIVSQIDSVTGGGENTPEGAVYPGATMPARGRGVDPGAAGRGRGAPPAVAAAPQLAGAAQAPVAPAAAAGRGRGGVDQLQIRYNSIEGAKRHSSPGFLVLPNQEFFGSPLGGHTDLLFSHDVYWLQGRAPGQPLVDDDPKYGKVYRIGSADDLMEMARREDVLINMPHPRTKGSTGYPDSVKDLPFFNDPHYQGIGFRWGMGLDRSERRLCEYRCQPLIDDMNNWVADKPIPPKYILSISEVRHQQPGDDIYSSSPVTYVKLATLPASDNVASINQALMRGDSFVTSGEVLINSLSINGSGNRRTIVANLEWTFPLDFVEVISGDGVKTERQVIPATELAPMSSHRFEIPFNAAGKKWVRFAAWDSAGNGAMGQPVKLTP